MLLDKERKKIRRFFLWEKHIREAVSEARTKREESKHYKSALGYDDPTGGIVVRKYSLIRRVSLQLHSGKRIIINHPELWLKVLEDTYALYEGQLIAELIRARARHNRKSPEALADLNCISLNTYYRWEREFLDDAALLAAERGILRQNK